jgi:hypothetical protein
MTSLAERDFVVAHGYTDEECQPSSPNTRTGVRSVLFGNPTTELHG